LFVNALRFLISAYIFAKFNLANFSFGLTHGRKRLVRLASPLSSMGSSVYPSEVLPLIRSFLVANNYRSTVSALDKELSKNVSFVILGYIFILCTNIFNLLSCLVYPFTQQLFTRKLKSTKTSTETFCLMLAKTIS
jgi:hypothetical protein